MCNLENKQEQVSLRALEPTDIDILYQWENDTALWNVSNTRTPFSRYLLQKYLDNAHEDIYTSKQLRLVVEYKAEAAGLIDLYDFDPYHQRAGVGILLHHSFRKKGLATTALELFVQYGFQYLGLHQLYCTIGAENTDSMQLFEKQGFVQVGQRKDWLKTAEGWEDEYIYQRLNS